MQGPLIATHPLTVGDILDRTVRLLRARFSEFILLPLVFLVPLAVLQAVAILTSTPVINATPALDPNNPFSPILERFLRVSSATAGASGWLSWIGLVNSLVTIAIPLMITYQAIQILHGRSPSLGENIKGGLRHVGRFLLSSLLIGMGLLIVAIVVVGLLAICLGSLGILIFIPFVLFFATRIAVFIVAMVNEHAGPIESLKRSWTLTEGLFWRTFGFSLIVTVLGWVIMFLPALITSILIVSMPPGSEKLLASLDSVSSSLITAVVFPFANLASTTYYFDLLVRKEAYDLTLRVQQTETTLKDQEG